MILLKDYYKGRDTKYAKDLTNKVIDNAVILLAKINKLLEYFGEDRGCNSGWRPYTVQMEINPRAPRSKHVTGDAIDLEDANGKLKAWCLANLQVLESLGLYMEDPKSTPTWVHLQQVPPNSKRRVFKP